MKTKRGLSGMYFMSKDEQTGELDSIAFEDLSESEQDRIMDNRETVWLKSLAKQLANVINKIADHFDIINQQEG
jgi:hypothetical protein